jgi:hypothetical protein
MVIEAKSFFGEGAPLGIDLDAHKPTARSKRGEGGGAGAEEGVEDEVAFGGGGEENTLEKGERLLRGMLAEFFLPGFGRRDRPDGLHLLAAGDFLHQLVVKGVARLFVFRGPDDGFGGMGEIAARKIGRRIGLDPGDVVQELEFELLHGEADGMDDVAGAADPEGAVGLEDALAGGEPSTIKFMVGVSTAGTVPFAFVDADHAAGVAGDAVVGKEVGRVGEDEVDGVGGEGGEDVEAIALEDADVVLGVAEGGVGELGRGGRGGLGGCMGRPSTALGTVRFVLNGVRGTLLIVADRRGLGHGAFFD